MASRYNLPHLDIKAFASAQGYVGESGFPNNSDVRIRNEHGRRIQNELRVALDAADRTRPIDERLPAPSGTFLEVELRRGAQADILDQKPKKLRTGATKVNETNERTVALYVPDHARPVLDQILDDYLNGPLTEAGNPPKKSKVESIEAIRTARLETFGQTIRARFRPRRKRRCGGHCGVLGTARKQ
jgi:hypothetical protein